MDENINQEVHTPIDEDTAKKIDSTFSPIKNTDRPIINQQSSNTTKSHRHNIKRIALLTGFVIIVVIFSTILYNTLYDTGDNSAADQVKDVLSTN